MTLHCTISFQNTVYFLILLQWSIPTPFSLCDDALHTQEVLNSPCMCVLKEKELCV